MNGNIFNYSLASEPYSWGCSGCNALAIPPAPPGNISTMGEPIFVQSYINAYNTAFNQQNSNYQAPLYRYQPFTPNETNSNFVPGTFGYFEGYSGSLDDSQSAVTINYLQDDINAYASGNPYLFVSAGSGGGSGFMYLDWIIVTYGVPYVVNIS